MTSRISNDSSYDTFSVGNRFHILTLNRESNLSSMVFLTRCFKCLPQLEKTPQGLVVNLTNIFFGKLRLYLWPIHCVCCWLWRRWTWWTSCHLMRNKEWQLQVLQSRGLPCLLPCSCGWVSRWWWSYISPPAFFPYFWTQTSDDSHDRHRFIQPDAAMCTSAMETELCLQQQSCTDIWSAQEWESKHIFCLNELKQILMRPQE